MTQGKGCCVICHGRPWRRLSARRPPLRIAPPPGCCAGQEAPNAGGGPCDSTIGRCHQASAAPAPPRVTNDAGQKVLRHLSRPPVALAVCAPLRPEDCPAAWAPRWPAAVAARPVRVLETHRVTDDAGHVTHDAARTRVPCVMCHRFPVLDASYTGGSVDK